MSYDPFERGPLPTGTRTLAAESSRWPIEVWYPAEGKGADDADVPLIVYSHHSGGHRRAATYLCTHLASHGYRVAALDHAETVRGDLQRPATESDAEREARIG